MNGVEASGKQSSDLADPFGEEEEADFGVISFQSVEDIERSIVDSPFRAIYQTNNFLLPQIIDVVDDSKTVNLRPEYQRRSRWTAAQKSKLVESFILNIPVPPIFLFEGDFARYEVMDGQQRLLAIREFMSNQFKLSSLKVLSPLNGRTFATLPPRTKRTLERASVSAIVLLKESKSALRDAASGRTLELRKFVFERLNTGGKHLNAQELRNAVYSGPFNDLVVELARGDRFADIWGIPRYTAAPDADSTYEEPARKANTLYRTMGDCQIVLRFFALREDKYIVGSMRSILDRCMERELEIDEKKRATLARDFDTRLGAAYIIFDSMPFRLSPQQQPSEGMYDAVMGALDRLWGNQAELINRRLRVQELYWAALADPTAVQQFTGRANTSTDIKQRISAMQAIMVAALQDG